MTVADFFLDEEKEDKLDLEFLKYKILDGEPSVSYLAMSKATADLIVKQTLEEMGEDSTSEEDFKTFYHLTVIYDNDVDFGTAIIY